MSTTVSAMSGRKWKRTRDHKNSVSVKYRCLLDVPIALGDEGIDIGGVPAPGTSHPECDDLNVASVDYEEESSPGGQKIVVATVNYEPKSSASETTTQQEGGVVYQVDEWGWDSGTEERDLLEDVESTSQSPKPVANSAGDVFDTAPRVTVSAPVFTKVMKFAARQSGAMNHVCKVNQTETTIGGKTCAAGTLLCFVSEKRIFGDPNWNYAYTIQLKYKSNKVILSGSNDKTEIGWDVAVVDAGMRQIDPNDATRKKKVLITVRDEETNQPKTVSSPALLDGNGYAISGTDPHQEPRNLRFKAYERTSFPGWFYSEPAIVTSNQQNNS